MKLSRMLKGLTLGLALIGLVFLGIGGQTPHAEAAGPQITVAHQKFDANLAITGQGFTPGGDVVLTFRYTTYQNGVSVYTGVAEKVITKASLGYTYCNGTFPYITSCKTIGGGTINVNFKATKGCFVDVYAYDVKTGTFANTYSSGVLCIS